MYASLQVSENILKLELVYLPKGKYCVYPGMVYMLAIVMPPTPFWMTKNEFRSHFSPFQINTQLYYFFDFFFTKWLPAAILDDRKSPSITFLAISNQYATFISFDFVQKMAAAAILDYRKSLLITFLAISDQ